MNPQLFLILYLISIPVFVVIDLLWITVIAKTFYQDRLRYHLGQVNRPAAAVFYLVFLLGLGLFATYPTVTKGVLASGVVLGALYGFFTYATYGLTNQAMMKDWPIAVTLIDIIWGTFIGAMSTAVTYILYAKFF